MAQLLEFVGQVFLEMVMRHGMGIRGRCLWVSRKDDMEFRERAAGCLCFNITIPTRLDTAREVMSIAY